MSEPKHLCDLWEHTIVKTFKHDLESQLGIMIKGWIRFNKLENFNSLLNYTIDDFTPSGNLCYINENGDILHQTPLHELFNLRWYIQHLIDEMEMKLKILSVKKMDETNKLEIHQVHSSP